MKWTDLRHRRFASDLEKHGYEVVEYSGRFGYEGPAVKCSQGELLDVIRATRVNVVWDDLGKGHVVYPDCRQRIGEALQALNFSNALKNSFGINL